MPNKNGKKNNKDKKAYSTKKDFVKNNRPEKVEKVEKVEPVKMDRKEESLFNELKQNQPFIVATCFCVILLGALILTLCVKRIPKVKNGDEVLATLKGKTITAQTLYQQLKEENGTSALIDIVDDYITSKEVKVTKEDKEYVQDVVDYYKQYAEYYNTDLATFLANYVGLNDITTEEEFFDFVLNDYKKTLAVKKLIGDQASEKDLKEYYNENYSEKLTVRHILVEVDADAEDQDKAEKEALQKAQKLIKKLNETDSEKVEEKFIELAKNNSDDTGTYSNGGLMEDFAKNDVVSEFWEASEKLKDGKYTKEPVKTTYGYHIIYRVSSKAKEKYKDVKEEVKKKYAEQLLSSDSTLLAAKWDELRKQYKLSIKDDEIKAAYKNMVKEATKTDDEEKTEE